MTTRKELIERIQAMQLGTQEMLDAAADDARRIPFDTLFVCKEYGVAMWRCTESSDIDARESVLMWSIADDVTGCCSAADLRPMTED